MPAPATAIGESVADLVKVSIEDSELCARYTARVIKGVKIGPSPDWLAERVTAAGARSINNIVDATNYIMFELGQPLHAFDLDTFAKDVNGKVHIVVRAAKDGESFTTLDDVKRELDSDITCIVDGNADGGRGATVALAGVMGGLDSEITDASVNILLESATFSSAHTSRTSRKLQLFSESSARYERGVDGATCDEFSARAAALMVEVAGGELCEGVVDVYPAPVQMPELILRVKRMQALIGAEISAEEATGILSRLGCAVKSIDADNLSVVAPTFRPDLTREIDLYEEVLRIWGMDRVQSTLPGGRLRIGEKTPEQHCLSTIDHTLRACGLNQTMTYVFASPEDNANIKMSFADNQQPVELINPMNSEQSHLRRSILPGLLRSVAYNLNHGVGNVHLYETGTVFYAAEGRKLPKERQMLCGVLAGSWTETSWNDPGTAIDFFDGKGIAENLLRELNSTKLRFKALAAEDASWLQPGRGAEVIAGSKQIGWLGEMHPQVSASFDISVPVVAFEFDLKALTGVAEQARAYKDIPQYPAVTYDLALVVSEEVSSEKIMQVIGSAAGTLLDELRLFDVYRDAEKLGAGKKSLAFGLSYRAADRTLTADEVEKLHQKVINKVTGATGGEVRA
jgi:phenylalanyl-tRNA synthetase beta chain